MSFRSVEVCAGAGGQAIGLHHAGFLHEALVEVDRDACDTLRQNGRNWGWADKVHHADLREWVPSPDLAGIDLLAGGVPCPPFSIAGHRLGGDDERDLFPVLLNLVSTLEPRAVQVENVKGLLTRRFDAYRTAVEKQLESLGYVVGWKLLNAADFGVPQLRQRTVLVALRAKDAANFEWPAGRTRPRSVGATLVRSMKERGWEAADDWADQASGFAPTLVGGSKKHGGADLGPTRAREAWARLGVDGLGVADEVPGPGFVGRPKLTVQQTALIQGFPAWWKIQGRKTSAYRQVGNAFPPPVAEAVGRAIRAAFEATDQSEAAA